MIRTMFSVMLGMVVATAVALAFELLGRSLFPLPAGSDSGAIAIDLVLIAPLSMLVLVTTGRLAGAMCGAWVAARLSRRRAMSAAISVGSLMTLSCLLDAWLAPQPLWMTLVGVVGSIPLAWCGGRLALRRLPADTPASR